MNLTHKPELDGGGPRGGGELGPQPARDPPVEGADPLLPAGGLWGADGGDCRVHSLAFICPV